MQRLLYWLIQPNKDSAAAKRMRQDSHVLLANLVQSDFDLDSGK